LWTISQIRIARVRAVMHGNQKRYDLGSAAEGDEDIGGLSPLGPKPGCR
jgi:hypothetical protein